MSSTVSNTLEEEWEWVKKEKKTKKKSGQICANIYSSFTDLHY